MSEDGTLCTFRSEVKTPRQTRRPRGSSTGWTGGSRGVCNLGAGGLAVLGLHLFLGSATELEGSFSTLWYSRIFSYNYRIRTTSMLDLKSATKPLPSICRCTEGAGHHRPERAAEVRSASFYNDHHHHHTSPLQRFLIYHGIQRQAIQSHWRRALEGTL